MFVVCLVIFVLYVGNVNCMPYQIPLMGKANDYRTLVLVENTMILHSHSLFFNDMRILGHQLTFQVASSPDVHLSKYGVDLYDNVILLAPNVQVMNTITFNDIIQFVDRGGNLFIGLDSSISDEMRNFVLKLGVQVGEESSIVKDHVVYSAEQDPSHNNSVIVASSWIHSKTFLGDFAESASSIGILYSGVGLATNSHSIFASTLLHANPTSILQDTATGDVIKRGSSIALVVAIQARNNARITITGSLNMLSNHYFSSRIHGSKVSNEQFANEMMKWTFGERGILRFGDIRHHKSDLTPPDVILHEKDRPDLPITLYPDPELTRNSLVYRIKDEIVFSFMVEGLHRVSRSSSDDENIVGNSQPTCMDATSSSSRECSANYQQWQWKPFCASDMQLEFVMLDPYIRTNMTCDPASNRMVAKFVAPDNYGVFKFRVMYRRPGYSVLHSETQVSIRPFKHNEYERFIVAATPYYSSSVGAVIAFFVFSVAFLYSS